MRLLSSIAVILFLFNACKTTGYKPPNSYDYTPVLLHASKKKQDDSIGFNLVRSMHELLYPRILTGDLPIWENSEKKIRISKESFVKLEQQTIVPFIDGNDLFIHEAWQIFKRNFDFGILGFSFAGTTKTGRRVNYGYIDAADVIDLLKNRTIDANANGNGYLNYWDALNSKSYHFNLVQFGNDNFKDNPVRAFQLKAQALVDEKILRDFYTIPQEKKVQYRILSPLINSSKENKQFYQVLELFINNNRQLLLNAGGASAISHLDLSKLELNNVVVQEKWTKQEELILQQLEFIEVFVGKGSVKLSKEVLQENDLRINLQGIEEYLTEKTFAFSIQQINSDDIAAKDAADYYKRLKNNNWKNINP
jgi:hypothetical protein